MSQKNRQNKFTIYDLLSFSILVLSVFLIYKIVVISKERQEIAIDKAEIGSAKYGLFSVYEWRTKITKILNKKIDEFELDNENQGELQEKIEETLYWVLDEVKRIMDERASQSFMGIIQSILGNLIIDFEDLRTRVPEFAKRALEQLGDDATMADIKIFIKFKLEDYLQRTFGDEDSKIYLEILTKYGFDKNRSNNCVQYLSSSITFKDRLLQKISFGLILSAFLVFFIFYLNSSKSIYSVLIIFLTCCMILFAGLLTPMIDLDARISKIEFFLMGEPVVFDEQILFFHSKSILDVIIVLIKNNKYDSIIAGVLIFMFSVIFPIVKLHSCALVIYNPKNIENKITNFLVLKLGKWSMADVIVVAILMAYTGFQGIINSQLAKLKLFSNHIEVLTTNNTQLQVGFIIFLSFCIFGIIFSTMLDKFIRNKEVTIQGGSNSYLL